jgi:hypothetical protein
MIAALVNTPLTGVAETARREKLRALRADGWIPPEEEDGSPPGKCDPEKTPNFIPPPQDKKKTSRQRRKG